MDTCPNQQCSAHNTARLLTITEKYTKHTITQSTTSPLVYTNMG